MFEGEIPNIRIRNIGTILNPLEVVEARIVRNARGKTERIRRAGEKPYLKPGEIKSWWKFW